VNESEIEKVLARCERELGEGRAPDLGAAGFWRAVGSIKRRPNLIARFADRVAVIDREAFRRRVRLCVPAPAGIALLTLGSLFAIVVLWIAAAFQPPARELVVLVGTGALLVSTHDLAHFVVGSIAGIHFTEWFVDLPPKPQPGLKIDYASYLRATPLARAWMHASGAIVSKLVPFAVLPYAVSIGAGAWALVALAAIGLGSIVTDATLSVRASDWKRFRREMKLARR
jgi:hypothetical protein